MPGGPEVRIVGARAKVLQGRETIVEVPVAALVDALSRVRDVGPRCQILPRAVRAWTERRDATAVALELPPQARSVRWIRDDSEKPFGRGVRYHQRFLSFPYLILMLVFRGESLTNQHQLYYRNAPLEADGEAELLLPNLYNVAEAYGQRCWVCLQHVRIRASQALPEVVDAVAEHVLSAAFNRSSDEHEGNSYWEKMRAIDPRVSSVEAWEEATRRSPWFALEVPWTPAGTSVTRELHSMLDQVVAPAPPQPTATDLAGLIAGCRPRRARR